MIRAYDDNGNVIDMVAWEQKIRADAIDEIIKDYCITDNFGYEYVIIDKATLEQLKEKKNEN